MGCTGYIKAVKLDRKGMLLLAKHLLHIKKKSGPQHIFKKGGFLIYILDAVSYLFQKYKEIMDTI
jgi:hypothetical protein